MKWNILYFVAAQSNHSESDEEAPTTPVLLATSISWTSDDTFSHFFSHLQVILASEFLCQMKVVHFCD